MHHFVGQVINHVLNCLEVIDKQNFEKVETNNSLDVLYHKLFASGQANKDGNEVASCLYLSLQ